MKIFDFVHVNGDQLLRCHLNRLIEHNSTMGPYEQDPIVIVRNELIALTRARAIEFIGESERKEKGVSSDRIAQAYVDEYKTNKFFEKN